jgi:hypothetical protein
MEQGQVIDTVEQLKELATPDGVEGGKVGCLCYVWGLDDRRDVVYIQWNGKKFWIQQVGMNNRGRSMTEQEMREGKLGSVIDRDALRFCCFC